MHVSLCSAFMTRWVRRVLGSSARFARAAVTLTVGAVSAAAVGQGVGQAIPSVPEVGGDVAPASYSGMGSYYNPSLDSVLRFRYNSQSYGQVDGNFDIGTFKAFTLGDTSMAFADAQITMSDKQGIGYNLGFGYRTLVETGVPQDGTRIHGISLWSDGTNTEADNFFAQVGVSLESIGDLWDVRFNSYIPVSEQTQTGKFLRTGATGFSGTGFGELTRATVDTSFYTNELELARRLGNRDAWGFAGGYHLKGSSDDTLGYRVGLRGYAHPDVLVQFAVNNDEIFNTNAVVSVSWMIGRTRTSYTPTCSVLDRFREPVLRNDYVVLAQSSVNGVNTFSDADGDPLRILHIDSTSGAGGNGTFETPFMTLAEAQASVTADDIVLVHGGSTFNGEGITLADNVRLLGEGNNIANTVVTSESGTVTLPETATGALAGPSPTITGAPVTAITLADNNEVSNFVIDGANTTAVGIGVGANGAGDPNLHDLTIQRTTTDGIQLTPFARTDTADFDNDGNTTEKIVAFNVNVNDVTFDANLGNDIDIDAFTTEDINSANVTLQEVLNLTNVTSTNGGAASIRVANAHTAGTLTVDNLAYDGGTGAAGGIELASFDGTGSVVNSSFTGGNAASVSITGDTDGNFTLDNTNTVNNITGNGAALAIDGGAGLDGFAGNVIWGADIVNNFGKSVTLANLGGGTVTVNGNIGDTGDGISIADSSGGTVLFAGNIDLNLNTPGNTAVEITNNAGADISFGGELDIFNDGGQGFVATGGGTVAATGNNNTISVVNAASGLQVTGMDVSGGLNFESVTVGGVGVVNAIDLANNTGSAITIGDTNNNQGDGGVINAASGAGVQIAGTGNVNINGLRITNTTGASAVNLNGSSGTLNFTSLDVETSGVNAVTIVDNSGSVVFDNDTTIESTTGNALQIGDGSVNSGGSGAITMNGDITSTTGRNLIVQDLQSGSSVNMLGDITDGGFANSQGILITDNASGSTVNVLGTNVLNTGANDAVTVTNNTGADISLAGLDVTTTSGDGFVASGGADLTVAGNNRINAGTGTAINMNSVNIVGQATFDSATATGTNGVILTNLTGDQVTIGDASGAAGSGGLLGTTQQAISITNSANVQINNVDVNSAANHAVAVLHTDTNASTVGFDTLRVTSATGLDGLNVRNTGSGSFTLNLNDSTLRSGAASEGFDLLAGTSADNTDIRIDNLTSEAKFLAASQNGAATDLRISNSTINDSVEIENSSVDNFDLLVENTSIDATGTTDIAFQLNFTGVAQDADVLLQNNPQVAAGDNSAFALNGNLGSLELDFMVDNTSFSNNSGTSATAVYDVGSGANVNANVIGNTFANADAGGEFEFTNLDTASTTNLHLQGNANVAGTYELTTPNAGAAPFDFNVQALGTVGTRQASGTVNLNPGAASFGDVPGPVQEPILP